MHTVREQTNDMTGMEPGATKLQPRHMGKLERKKKKNVFFVLMYFLNSLLSKKKKKKNLGKLLWYKRSKTLRDILLLESNKLGLHDITCH